MKVGGTDARELRRRVLSTGGMVTASVGSAGVSGGDWMACGSSRRRRRHWQLPSELGRVAAAAGFDGGHFCHSNFHEPWRETGFCEVSRVGDVKLGAEAGWALRCLAGSVCVRAERSAAVPWCPCCWLTEISV